MSKLIKLQNRLKILIENYCDKVGCVACEEKRGTDPTILSDCSATWLQDKIMKIELAN